MLNNFWQSIHESKLASPTAIRNCPTLCGTLQEIEILNHVAHLCITQLPATGQSRILTPRQSEVLELVADGKSVQDISVLLDRKPATVDKHLRGARDTLGVETTAQAVRKASVLNQIFVLDNSALPGPE